MVFFISEVWFTVRLFTLSVHADCLHHLLNAGRFLWQKKHNAMHTVYMSAHGFCCRSVERIWLENANRLLQFLNILFLLRERFTVLAPRSIGLGKKKKQKKKWHHVRKSLMVKGWCFLKPISWKALNITWPGPGYEFSISYYGDLAGFEEGHLRDTIKPWL